MSSFEWPLLTLGALEGVGYRIFMRALGGREALRFLLPALGWVLGTVASCGEAAPEDEPTGSSSTTGSVNTSSAAESSATTGPSTTGSATTGSATTGSATTGSATTGWTAGATADLVTSTTEAMPNLETSWTGSSGDASSDTGGDDGTALWVDLSACGWEPVCDTVTFGRSGMAEPQDAAECVARAALGGSFAAVEWVEIPRGETSIFEVHAWILLVGNGTALFQTRTLHCDEDYTLNGDDLCEGELWWSEAQRTVRCEVVVNPYACREDCPEGEDCSCAWNPGDGSGLINCVEHSISDCSEIDA